MRFFGLRPQNDNLMVGMIKNNKSESAPLLQAAAFLTPRLLADRVRAASQGRWVMDPLAVFMRILAGTAIAIAVISTVAVLMRGSKS